ncbi:hypothetical protein AMTR_s00044p00086850 [Amborella trichopoda]|uniref:PRLI-interacting factor A n=2 Tax=Amborella trichopoda TaxID=13333 RepID=U5D4G2_AMBTC|nr:hypothetical protein AMTR_s00044p00086850 [Amborella trichopoda]
MDQPHQKMRSYRNWNPGTSGAFMASQEEGSFSLKPNRTNWKAKKADKYRRKASEMAASTAPGNLNTYQPPALKDLQAQNRLKSRRFYHKRNKYHNRVAPYAPRNTTSFIIRAKKSGGIASLVSPCPVTPAILPTPVFSPSREGVIDMAKEELGVNGYGSMKGLIRLRSPGFEHPNSPDESSESESSDVEEHVEVERRLDHDLSRFEMIYPSGSPRPEQSNLLENRVDDQDTHIAQLEEENLTLKERLFLMEQELGDLRRRLQVLETGNMGARMGGNGSDNEAAGDVCSEKSVGDEGDGEASCACG